MTIPSVWTELEIRRLSHGGYMVLASEPYGPQSGRCATPPLAAFTHLGEALEFMRTHILSDEKEPL